MMHFSTAMRSSVPLPNGHGPGSRMLQHVSAPSALIISVARGRRCSCRPRSAHSLSSSCSVAGSLPCSQGGARERNATAGPVREERVMYAQAPRPAMPAPSADYCTPPPPPPATHLCDDVAISQQQHIGAHRVGHKLVVQLPARQSRQHSQRLAQAAPGGCIGQQQGGGIQRGD